MPELPEVELYRRAFEEVALEQTIVSIEAHNEGRMLLDGLKALQATLIGQRMIGTQRIGKYLFIQLDQHHWLMWHFGLTGSFTYYRDEAVRHRFARIWLTFDNGWQLSFNSMRKFSRLALTDNVADYRKQKRIGQDALDISEDDFVRAYQRRKALIKPTLLNQYPVAGIGNWIADEMLHRVQVHPEARCHSLSEAQYRQLHAALQDIIQTTIRYEADYPNFPEHFLIRTRKDGGHCPRCSRELTRLVVGGRGTYTCDTCQPAPSI